MSENEINALLEKDVTSFTDEELAAVRAHLAEHSAIHAKSETGCLDVCEDRKASLARTITSLTEMTRALAHVLSDRGETEGDLGISYIMDGGLNNPHAVLIADREWRSHLQALPEAPTEETVVASLIDFYARLGKALDAEGIGRTA